MKNINKMLTLLILILLVVSGCYSIRYNPSNSNPTPTPGRTASPTPGRIPGPTPSPTPSPTPGYIPSPTPNPNPVTWCEMGPDQNIYFIDNQTLKKWNHSTQQISNLGTFDNNVSCMVIGGPYLYISEGVKIWQYDISLGTLTHKFNAPATIHSLYYIGGYLISNDSSGAWSTNRLIKLPEFTEKDSQEWLDPSRTYVNIESQNTFYILRDESIPDDLCYQQYNKTTETLGTYGDSPYHGDYNFGHPLKQFDTELKIVVGTGLIFNVSGVITYDGNLGYSYRDLVFNGGKIYLLNQNNPSARLLVLNKTAPYSLINTPLNYPNRNCVRLFVNGSDLVVVTVDYSNHPYIEAHNFSTL